MTFAEFQKIHDELLKVEKTLMSTKGVEYTEGIDSRFRNFEVIAAELETTPERILWVYVRKHLQAIVYYLKQDKEASDEKIISRIQDVRNYLLLLSAMIIERQTQERDKQV